jgi:dihydrodipicolinate synthase/N-acetylneuraminate lyase
MEHSLGRRQFVQVLAAGLPAASLAAGAASAKRIEGIFPIAQSPFTDADALDVNTLVEELKFIDRGRVHGFVWPQLASEWSTLSESERMAGTEAVCAEGKKLRPAVVIGAQALSIPLAVQYAKHAEKCGADAVIALPPQKADDPQALLEYYSAIGKAISLPLMVQAVGNMSVDSIVALSKAIPNLRYVKDEAGQPLFRLEEFKSKTDGRLRIFTGSHGKTLIDEMLRGFSGTMPASPFADIYAASWDLWHEGKRREAVEMFGNAAVLIQEISTYGMESNKYLLCLRGVFKNTRVRQQEKAKLDETGKRVLRDMLDLMKPYFKA